MDFKMKLITLYLPCLILMVVVTGLEFKVYCVDQPGLSCAEQHILECLEEQVITTDVASFHVIYYKNKNHPECQADNDECKNKTSCCTYISSGVTREQSKLTADDNILLINFIKTECSSKSSCIVSSYYSIGSSVIYDYINYTYGCIPASKDEINVNFLVNRSTTFTGNRFPTIYYLDYTGYEKKDDDVILNRECIITTTKRDITLTIKTLNLQADGCYRFYISGYIIPEYCSQSGSATPPKGTYIGKNTATIRLENVLNKDGDSFSILVKAAGNVTIDCRTIEHVDKQVPSICYPVKTTETSTSPTKKLGMDNQKTNYSESNLGAIIGGTVVGLVFLNIIVIVIVVLVVRRKLRVKQTTDEIQHYSSLDGLRNGPEHNYVGMETTSPT